MKVNLIVDSGAYSAFTQGKPVDLKAYADFVLQNQSHITKTVNLDVIDPQGPEAAASKGFENLLYMRSRGIDAMPVLHARESFRWIDKMFDLGIDYIGLSGTSLVSPVENRIWHDLIWQYVTDKQGFPIAKFHAFGDTSVERLITYPFYSADSATWMIQAGRAGRIRLKGKSYQLRSHKISDSNYISANDPAPQKQAWEECIRELGLCPDAVMSVQGKGSELAMIRSYLVASELLNLQEQSASCTKLKLKKSLLLGRRMEEGGVERLDPVKIYFVISPSAIFMNFPVLAALNIKNILVSYYYVVTAPKDFWETKMIPFLDDPVGFCQSDEKLKRYWDKLHECILTPVAV